MAPNTSSEIVGLFSGKTKDKSGASYVALRLRDIATRRLRKCTSLRALLLHPAWPAVLSCLLYSFCSISMVIVNKLILTTYEFKYPMVLMLHQNIMSIGLLRFAKWAKWVDFEPMVASKVKVWLPLNFFFVAMLLSGFYRLVHGHESFAHIYMSREQLWDQSGKELTAFALKLSIYVHLSHFMPTN
jgi:hypothetical protein